MSFCVEMGLGTLRGGVSLYYGVENRTQPRLSIVRTHTRGRTAVQASLSGYIAGACSYFSDSPPTFLEKA